jgi:hypothetical protein
MSPLDSGLRVWKETDAPVDSAKTDSSERGRSFKKPAFAIGEGSRCRTLVEFD